MSASKSVLWGVLAGAGLCGALACGSEPAESGAAASNAGGQPGGGGQPGAGGSGVACDEVCQAQGKPSTCISTRDYFETWAWPQVFSTCVTCHTTGGAAEGTRLMLRSASTPGFLAFNHDAVEKAAGLESGGAPLLLLKPTLAVPHQGGQKIIPNSKPHAVLIELLKQFKAPVVCGDGKPPPAPVTQGVELLDAYGTFRKATLTLVGRPPTSGEIDALDAGGIDAVGGLLDAVMKEPIFDDKVREIFADALLTDGFLSSNTLGHEDLVRVENLFPSDVGAWDGLASWQYASTPNGIRTNDALAREPLEFYVHVTRKDGSLAEVLTAKYRLLNAWSARFLRVPFQGVAPENIDLSKADPRLFVESKVPLLHEREGSEYAGVLSTTAFLARYPNTPTNFNRKRARFTYKHFLNHDIMKTAPRIDAAAIQSGAHPTRNAEVCTGCHAKIDPFAGALGSWTNCGYDDTVKQWRWSEKTNGCSDRGWLPDSDVFPPGTGEGTSQPLSDDERKRGSEVLAAHIVAQDGFAEAIVSQVMVGLLNRPLLEEPQEPTSPGYAGLLAAVDHERSEFKRLVGVFKDKGLRLKPLIQALVMSPLFRAKSADTAGRVELTGQGGVSLSTPEDIDRRLEALFGVPWQAIMPGESHDLFGKRYLRRADAYKVSYGGMTGSKDGVKVRQRQVSSVSALINERMALMVACTTTGRDLDRPAGQRKLFPFIDKSMLPSGDASMPDQKPILENLRFLHERFWGERVGLADPELLATYELLSQVRAEGKAAVASGQASASLDRPCAGDVDLISGQLASPPGTVADPEFVIRAWQTVIAYLLMDARFLLDP